VMHFGITEKADEGQHTPCNNAGLISKVSEEIATENILNIMAKCRPTMLDSRNIRYMRIFAGFPVGGDVKYNKCYTYVQTLNKNTCFYLSIAIASQHYKYKLGSLKPKVSGRRHEHFLQHFLVL